MWWIYALLSALFASLTAIFAKVGITGVNSNLATAIRTVIILMVAWGIVLARGETKGIATLSKQNLIFLIISGIATGLSWIFYFKAVWNRNFTAFNFWCNRSLFTYYVYE